MSEVAIKHKEIMFWKIDNIFFSLDSKFVENRHFIDFDPFSKEKTSLIIYGPFVDHGMVQVMKKVCFCMTD